MNYPSSPKLISTDFDELFTINDYDAAFQMIMEEISLEDYSSSPTLSWTSSEKLVTTEVTSSFQTTLATSPMSPDIGNKGETKKRKRHKEDPIIHVFRTKSSIDKNVLDDGYKWRKYGKKPIKGNEYPRHYHKCTNTDCTVKKKTEIDTNNPEYLMTTYQGIHNHASPSVVYCDSDDYDLTSFNTLSFQTTNFYTYSHSAPN